ncbi:MAG: Uma2 family endonuclease [Bryobacteraceae bacterium]|jgi:Uma2 family endonuclease
MAVAAMVTLGEYLSTSYDPDREYVDGHLIERNAGTNKHSFVQLNIAMALQAQGLRTYVELRFQVRPNRYRIPDVLALAPGQKLREPYLRDTPWIVVEIVSRDDRVGDMNDKLRDYFFAGVPNVWVVDPLTRAFTVHEPGKSRTIADRVETVAGTVSIDVENLFRRLDEDEA